MCLCHDLPSFSWPSPPRLSPEPGPWSYTEYTTDALELLCAAPLPSDCTCSVGCPRLGNCFWSCLAIFLVQIKMQDTQRAKQSGRSALCPALTIPERPHQHFLSGDTALRLMCSHAHILCSLEKCEHSRSTFGPHWRRKYECTNREL